MDICITGTFICELKNRFLCLVRIGDSEELCYVPSSCHLSNFIDLKGKEILLVPNKTRGGRTKYSLFAVPFKRSYIVLNSSMANEAMVESIRTRRFSFLGKRNEVEREFLHCGYKCDLFIKDTNTIVEVKSLISTQRIASFPTVYSERSISQLHNICNLMNNGNKAVYCIVSLNPYVKQIELVAGDWYCELKRCVDCGLVVKAYTAKMNSNLFCIDREIDIVWK